MNDALDVTAQIIDINPSDDDLIATFISYRDWVAAETKRFKEHIADAATVMDACQTVVHQRLLERGTNSTAGDSGTAFFVSGLSVRCVDKDQYLSFCVEHFEQWGKHLLTAAASKEIVKLYIERTTNKEYPEGYPPPGLEVSATKEVQFRKAG